jgi:hypothetical protein
VHHFDETWKNKKTIMIDCENQSELFNTYHFYLIRVLDKSQNQYKLKLQKFIKIVLHLRQNHSQSIEIA